MSNFNEFAKLLDAYRISRNINKKQLADLAGLTPPYISLLSKGTRNAPSMEAVLALAKALRLNVEEGRRFFEAAGYANETYGTLLLDDRETEDNIAGIPRIMTFYGRKDEIEKLEGWITGSSNADRPSQLLVLLGVGGVGKTTLATKAVELVKKDFEYVHWYSLQNALPEETLATIIEDCLRFFSITVDQSRNKLDHFLDCLKAHRCLIILDNFESVFKSGLLIGEYETGFEEYGRLLQYVGSEPHRSCLLLTSREKPAEVAELESNVVHSLSLVGMEGEDGRAILRDKGLLVEGEAWKRLIQLYSGNPFTLKLVANSIRDLYAGDISAYLDNLEDEEEASVSSGVLEQLNKQFQRLAPIEQEVMYWLAIEREAVTIAVLQEDILQVTSKLKVPEALRSLLGRSLIEHRENDSFELTPLVLGYVSEQLGEYVYQEIITKHFVLLESHALLKAQTKDYIRKGQIRYILEPLKKRLYATFSQEEIAASAEFVPEEIEQTLKGLLDVLRKEGPPRAGYTAGNILNILLYLKCNIRGTNFSSLTVRQAYLREDGLPEVNFAHANLYGSVFTDTFGAVLSVTISFDGKLIAAGTVNGEVRIWRTTDGTLVHNCTGHTDWVRSVAFSADGKMLASGSHDQSIRLWDANTGQCIGILSGHSNRVRAVAFSPDENTHMLASTSDDKTILLWDVQTGQVLHILEEHDDKINAVTFHPSGNMLASVSHDGTIRLWNVHDGYQLKKFPVNGGWLWSVAFSPDEMTLACGAEDGTISLWNIDSGERFKTLYGHRARVNSVAFGPDEDTLVSGSDDETVQVWNITTEHSQLLEGHRNWVRSVVFSPDCSLIISGSDDETVRVWETSKYQCLYTLQGYSGWVHSAVFNADATLLVSGGEDTRVRIWNAKTGKHKTLREHTHRVRAVAFSPDNSKIASASDDQTVRIWDADNEVVLRTLYGHKHRVRSVAFSPDNSLIATGSDDQTIRISEVDSGLCIRILEGHTSRVYCTTWSRDGKWLASSSEDRTIRLWDMQSGRCVRVFEGHDGRVYSVAFSPDGTYLLSGSTDLTVRLWEVSTSTCIHVMKGHTRRICSVAYSPDGHVIASGSDDRTAILWSAETGKHLMTIKGHTGRVCSVAFSFDGTQFATGSYDGTIQLWHPETGKHITTLRSNRPYERMNITDVRGLTAAQKAMLKALGAIEAEK